MSSMFVPRVSDRPGTAGEFSSGPGVAPLRSATGSQIENAGAAMQSAGGGLLQAGLEIKHEIDEAAIKESDALLSEAYRKVLQDPESGYLGKVGKAAVNSRQDAIDEITRKRKEIGDRLQNDVQRRIFNEIADHRTTSVLGDVDAHFTREAKVYNIGQSDSLVNARLQDWARTGRESDKAVMLRQVDDLGNILGRSEAEIKQMRLQATSQGHAKIVQQLLQDDRENMASSHLRAATDAGEIDSGTAIRLRDMVGTKSAADRGQRLANELMAPKPLKFQPGQEPKTWAGLFQAQESQRIEQASEARDEIDRRFTNGEISISVRDQAIARLERSEEQHRHDLLSQANSTLLEAQKWLNDNPTSGIDDMANGNPDLKMRVDAYGMSDNIAQYAKSRDYSTDPKFLASVLAMTPAERRSVDIDTFYLANRSKLSTDDMNRVLGWIRSTQDKKPPAPTAVEHARDEEAIKVSARNVGLDVFKPGETKSEVAEAFARYRLNALSAKAAQPDRPMPEILKEMEAERIRDASGVDRNPFTLSPDQKRGAYMIGPRGHQIPIEDVVDPFGVPAFATEIEKIRAANEIRRQNGQDLIPETKEQVIARWEELSIQRQRARESQSSQTLVDLGFRSQDGSVPEEMRGGSHSEEQDKVTIIEAAKMLGITQGEVRERLGRSSFWTAVLGPSVTTTVRAYGESGRMGMTAKVEAVTISDLARLRAQLLREGSK